MSSGRGTQLWPLAFTVKKTVEATVDYCAFVFWDFRNETPKPLLYNSQRVKLSSGHMVEIRPDE